MHADRWIGLGLLAALIALVGVGLWKTSGRQQQTFVAVVREARAVMGTDCRLAAVVSFDQRGKAQQALADAEQALRNVEARMSTWLSDSEVGRLNRAEADQPVPLSPQSVAVLRAAQEAWVRTDGAFDITCRPVVELWRRAGRHNWLPQEADLAKAQAKSNWQLIHLSDASAVKDARSARVDLGGIAKGYGVDRAAEALEAAGLSGGLIDVGGDLFCFGDPPAGGQWPVQVKKPWGKGSLMVLNVPGGSAVCTSGGYARYIEVDGRRYSHIVDPRTGRPADAALSVTVVARSAMTADIWATALSVLGPEGFERLPQGVEALVLLGTPDDYHVHTTGGFREYLTESLPEPGG